MAERNVRIENTTDSMVTLNLANYNDKVYPISARGVVRITEEELAMILNTSKAFELGLIRVLNPEVLSGDIDVTTISSTNTMTDKDIIELLSKTAKAIQTAVDKIDSVETMRRILAKANELDKPVKLVEMLNEKLEKVATA